MRFNFEDFPQFVSNILKEERKLQSTGKTPIDQNILQYLSNYPSSPLQIFPKHQSLTKS